MDKLFARFVDSLEPQKGFSLVEILISLGLMGLGVALFMTMQSNITRLTDTSNLKAGIDATTSVFQQAISDRESCEATLASNTITLNQDALTPMNFDVIHTRSQDGLEPLWDDSSTNPTLRGVYPGYSIVDMRLIMPEDNNTTAGGGAILTQTTPQIEIGFFPNDAKSEADLAEIANSGELNNLSIDSPGVYRRRIPLFVRLNENQVVTGCLSESAQSEDMVAQTCTLYGGELDPDTGACVNNFSEWLTSNAPQPPGEPPNCPAGQTPNPFISEDSPDECIPAMQNNCEPPQLPVLVGTAFQCRNPASHTPCSDTNAIAKFDANGDFECINIEDTDAYVNISKFVDFIDQFGGDPAKVDEILTAALDDNNETGTGDSQLCTESPDITPANFEGSECQNFQQQAKSTCTITAATPECREKQRDRCRALEYDTVVSELVLQKTEYQTCGGCEVPNVLTLTGFIEEGAPPSSAGERIVDSDIRMIAFGSSEVVTTEPDGTAQGLEEFSSTVSGEGITCNTYSKSEKVQVTLNCSQQGSLSGNLYNFSCQ